MSLGLACSPRDRGATPADTPLPAGKFIIRAFQRYPLVALSELHGNAESRALFESLVRDPEFSAAVSDIVVEFGNARYQDVADRYLAGNDVPADVLSRVWRDTTQVSGIFDLPMYAGMLAAVRDANARLAPGRRRRVWLGDPPIDWTAVISPADEDMNDWRDAFFARVVEDQIRTKGRRALLFVGGAHVSRQVIFPNSLIHLLDARRPGETLIVSILDVGSVSSMVAARLRQWPLGAAITVRDTWLGALDVKEVGFRFSRGTVSQDVDALALLSHAPLDYQPAPSIDPASARSAELERRRRLAEATAPFRGAAIRFAADRPALLPAAVRPLQAVVRELNRDGGLKLLVKAFADAREPDPDALSAARAHAVVDWLVRRGVARGRLEARGCGSARLLTFDENESERERNRRAELVRHTASVGCMPPW